MGGSGFSKELINAREIDLSSDTMRLQALASRDQQDVLAQGGADAGGTPFSSMSTPLSLSAAAGFTMTLGAGQAFAYLPGDATLTPDDSPYEIARWGAQTLSFGNPSGSDRIDLVVATPAVVAADPTTRNILIDPTLRTIASNVVNKTLNPVATIAVVAGTPGGTPVPPAVPAGAIPLAEVYVPTGAGSSAGFFVVPRLWRRAPYPMSTMRGIVSGMHLRWDLSADPTTTSSALSLLSERNRVLIDGELIEFSTAAPVVQDTQGGQNPFGVTVAAYARPYYIYAVGGRHCPQGQLSGGVVSPIVLVESLIAPDLSSEGIPSAPIGVPRGVTTRQGAVYIGVGFLVSSFFAGTTALRQACVMTDDMTFLVGGDFGGRINHAKVAASGVTEALGSLSARPLLSTRAVVIVEALTAAATTVKIGLPDRGDTTAVAPAADAPNARDFSSIQLTTFGSAPASGVAQGTIYFNPTVAQIWGGRGAGASDTIIIAAQGFDHRVPRLGTP